MYFLFTTVLTASFMIVAEFTAVCFVPAVMLTALYLYLFSLYFSRFRRTKVFIPLILISLSMHITFFLIELHKSYIKDVSIWVLALLLTAVCGFIAFGTSSKSGITAITHMAVPLFFALIGFAIINLLTGEITTSSLMGKNIYQYFMTVVIPPSTALSLTYMHKCRYRQIYPAFVSAIVISVSFFLFDAAFFKAIALNFIAPLIISVEMLVIKESILPRRDMLDKNKNE